MRRTLAISAAALLWLTGACAAPDGAEPSAATTPSSSPSTPQPTATADAVTPAPTLPVGRNLALSDMPDGWADLSYDGSLGAFLSSCARLSRGTRTWSPFLLTGGTQEVRTVISEVTTINGPPASGARDLRAVDSRRDCVRPLAMQRAEGLTYGPIGLVPLPASVVGSQAVGYRLTTLRTFEFLETDIEVNVVLLHAANREALLVTLAESEPFDPALLASLLKTLRARVAGSPA